MSLTLYGIIAAVLSLIYVVWIKAVGSRPDYVSIFLTCAVWPVSLAAIALVFLYFLIAAARR